jgi:hypothetical protein
MKEAFPFSCQFYFGMQLAVLQPKGMRKMGMSYIFVNGRNFNFVSMKQTLY